MTNSNSAIGPSSSSSAAAAAAAMTYRHRAGLM